MRYPYETRLAPDIIKRPKRAHARLARVIAMVKTIGPCVGLAQQLFAVESAGRWSRLVLAADRLSHCERQFLHGSASL